MKTKTFIEKVESNLFTVKESHDGTIIFIHPSRSDFNILAWVNKYENESHIYSVLPKDLAESLLAYTMTPIEEREEEKKYRYKFKPSIKTGGGGENLVFHLARCRYLSDLKLDASGNSYAKSSEAFHFTDKQVEEFTDEQKLLIQLCEKIEVTP